MKYNKYTLKFEQISRPSHFKQYKICDVAKMIELYQRVDPAALQP